MTFKKQTRVTALLLSAFMLFTMLTACGSLDAITGRDASADASLEAAATYDFSAAGEYFAADTVIMTVAGSQVLWDEFYYWMLTAVSNILSDKDVAYIEDWDAEFSGAYDMFGENMTYSEFVIYYAHDAVTMYRTIEAKFDEKGLTLNEDEVFTKEDYMEYYNLESEDEFTKYLESSYMSEELFNYIETVAAKYYMLLENTYGADGENLTDEEVLEYVDSYGYMQAKHIMLYTEDEEGVAYSDEKKAEVLASAEEILALLNSYEGDDLEGYFDELTAQYNEDTDMGSDGYIFTSGDMVAEFQAAVEGLSENEYSDIVETDHGYHIIFRTAVNPDGVPYGGYDTLRYSAAYTRFDSIVSAWQEEVAVEYSEIYGQISPMDIFTLS